MGTHSTCDASVSSALHNNAEPGHDDLAAFFLDNGNVRFGGLNADEHTGFEIGSITKTFNAELLRQQIASGDITLETTVGELIDVPGAPIADVNMEELANHTSGLSSVPVELISNRLAMVLSDGNPYREATADEIISYAGDAELKNRGQRNYSNYSHALLGQFLARIANVSYEELLRTSILEPAGMDETYLATSGSGEYSSRGLGLHGRAVEPWDMDGSAPAGAIRSTPADMAKYAQSVADHGRPEYGWARREMGGTEYTFHNGGTEVSGPCSCGPRTARMPCSSLNPAACGSTGSPWACSKNSKGQIDDDQLHSCCHVRRCVGLLAPANVVAQSLISPVLTVAVVLPLSRAIARYRALSRGTRLRRFRWGRWSCSPPPQLSG